ncbi:hypothetical protein E2562_026014 [Oryza meyeriana var. granulata]|uniref:Uncharacterized protein n=1 Tax=Oryza meyeriana var. granulata TaxID=110450 RepID=A0A6G1EPG5_9ORYZ|nr:hypothetical protein E2562_026014 [Oryza meyeriana var. granulata]
MESGDQWRQTSIPGSPSVLLYYADLRPLPPSSSPPRYSQSESDTDEHNDLYFNHLVDNFSNAATNVVQPNQSDDDSDFQEALQLQSDEYAESALNYYNNDEKNKIRWDLHKLKAKNIAGIFQHMTTRTPFTTI